VSFISKVYYAYSDVKLRDQDKSWALFKVRYVCVEYLRKWSKGGGGNSFSVPVKWRYPKYHSDDCQLLLLPC
jgi:hypothetical protein